MLNHEQFVFSFFLHISYRIVAFSRNFNLNSLTYKYLPDTINVFVYFLETDYLIYFGICAKQYAHILKFQHPKHFSLIILPWLSRKLILSKSNPESKLPMHISESSSETLSHGKIHLLYPQIVF